MEEKKSFKRNPIIMSDIRPVKRKVGVLGLENGEKIRVNVLKKNLEPSLKKKTPIIINENLDRSDFEFSSADIWREPFEVLEKQEKSLVLNENQKKELERKWKDACREAAKNEDRELVALIARKIASNKKNTRKDKEPSRLLEVIFETFRKIPSFFVDKIGNSEMIFQEIEKNPTNVRVSMRAFSLILAFIFFSISLTSFAYKGLEIKGRVLGASEEGYQSVSRAVTEISSQNFDGSSRDFKKAFEFFSEASGEIDRMGVLLSNGSRFFPYISKISSGKNLLEAGKHLSLAGGYINGIMTEISSLKKENSSSGKNLSLLDVLKKTESFMLPVKNELFLANESISKVDIDDLPEEMREDFIVIKKTIPETIVILEAFSENSHILSDVLGGEGPRKYLFLFQNNNEMRATGGFIGSYGLLDISNGKVKKFFIDGIFNPDGQLTEKIVPPKPIQKISAAWSLHDSNWFPDFPTSAKEAIVFYEKTGGATTDGVIAITPVFMEKLLEITGPIKMDEYGIVLDSKNFVEKTQYEVESHNQENKLEIEITKNNKGDALEDDQEGKEDPKKILSDLAPRVIDKILNSGDYENIIKAAGALMESLEEKHILIYSQNQDLQSIISKRGWSGEILESKKDYLSVINTNINGYKTDGVIEEKIGHKAEIREDGSIVDKVTIVRKHNGGNSEYEWWNKVNADYMRVYVPLGSKLIKVEGQTREVNEVPLDYDRLGFKRNPLVEREEKSMIMDETTGTRIYEENGKTVFANWTYVSPQETMEITYEYELPFKLFNRTGTGFKDGENPIDSYSLVVQKQSGSRGSAFESEIRFPGSYKTKWKTPSDLGEERESFKFSRKLYSDIFMAGIFEKEILGN